MAHRVFIIAELGSNPAPTWDLERYVEAAANAGAAGVKIQLWRASHFPEAERASKRPLEFPRARVQEFARLCDQYGLQSGASVFDQEAVKLAGEYLDFLKLAAREQDNVPLLQLAQREATRQHIPLYRSITTWFWACTYPGETDLFTIPEYPARMGKSLFYVSDGWRQHYGIFGSPMPWGWSSHTRGDADCILAAMRGASVIEKHMCVSPNDVEAGHSLTPGVFQRMVERCR